VRACDRVDGPGVRCTRILRGAFLLIVVTFSLLSVESRANDVPRRVLILHSFNYAFPATTIVSEAIRKQLPECLNVELQMPDMTGLELQRNLTRSGLRIPTVVITAHNEAGARERCESAGAAAFLSKPLQDASLLAAIESATGSAKSRAVPRPKIRPA